MNYYDNGFEEIFAKSLIDDNYIPENFYSPDFTTDGYLEKCWIQSEGIPFLIKFDDENDRTQCANEIIASKIGDLLNINVVQYSLCRIGDKIGCMCPSVIDNSNEELITGLQIKHDGLNNKEHIDLHNFFKKNFTEDYYKILLLDIIIHNTDRHEKNICLKVNKESNEIQLSKVFDNGRCLGCLHEDINYQIQDRDLKLPRDMKREDIIKEINENIKIPYVSLTELQNIIKSVYYQFQISDKRLQVALREIECSYKLIEKYLDKNFINYQQKQPSFCK